MEHSLRMNYRIRARVRPQGEGGLAVVLDRERAHAVLERRWLEVEPHLQERVDRGGGVALARRRRSKAFIWYRQMTSHAWDGIPTTYS